MKGKIIKYVEKITSYSTMEYEAIVIEYRAGYSIRKSWSDKIKVIDCPMVKIHWIREPSIKPPSALRRMSSDWNLNPQYSFGFAENSNNYIIEEWDEFKSEWYYLDNFKVTT
tara:strand:+ start:1602 stop:1937 length:336 start_codon:yes stop_codon:yes gene_type:complete